MNNNLDEYVRNYDYNGGVMQYATSYCSDIFLRYMVGKSVLELGPAEGVMTERLYKKYSDYTCVEGSSIFADDLIKRFSRLNVICSYFEDFEPDRKFDNIVLGHVLEHVDDPVEILRKCKSWIAEDGRILTAVPNSHSIHRQAAVQMKILKSEDELNSTDKKVGHRRVYNTEMLLNDFRRAEIEVIKTGGYWLKPLSNYQIEQDWNIEQINAFMELGENYPDIAAEIYVIAK